MKAIRFLLVFALIAIAMGFNAGGAKAGAFASYDSSILVQNLESAAGDITIYFYNQAGTVVDTISDPIGASEQITYFPLPSSLGTFNGSVIVSATVNVASISAIRGSAGESAGQYIAQSSGATVINLPVLMKNNGKAHNYTWFNVQNVGDGPTNLSVSYSDGTTNSFTGLAKGASHTFDQALETHNLAAFAGVVTSSAEDIVVSVIQETTEMLFASNGFKTGTTNPVAPLINYQPAKGLQTGFNIKNMSSTTATNVTVTYNFGGSTCTETQNIPAGEMRAFALSSLPAAPNPVGVTSNCPKGVVSVGSAEVTTNSGGVPLAGIINQLKYTQSASAYASFDKATATNKFVGPFIQDRNGPYDLWNSINMMNVGSVDTSITCTFTGVGYTYTSPTLSPGQGNVIILENKLGDPYVGGATCTANTSTAKIIAVINQQGYRPFADQMGAYEAISVP